MKKIRLFLDPILYFMEDSSGFASLHYLDLLKGEVVSPEIDDTISHEDVEDEDRYFPIAPITSDEGYEIMQDFAALEQSDEVRGHLISALEGKKPFRRFKDALADYPDTEEKFYAYKDNRLKKILRKQLAECGYTLEEETDPKGNGP
ncbi:MAG: UPF0158 family protein [Thermodesulfobacteriota bacterium]|nr:UPF0158 family protein [Thermodesulfobacteriota bacterium]